MYGSFGQRRRRQQQQQQSLRRNADGPVHRFLERNSNAYDKALDDLSEHIKNEEASFGEGWRRLDANPTNPRGGAFERRLSDDLILEVHVLYPRDREPER
jgi:hypothetical protein